MHELLANINTMITTYHSFDVKCRKYAYIKEATVCGLFLYLGIIKAPEYSPQPY